MAAADSSPFAAAGNPRRLAAILALLAAGGACAAVAAHGGGAGVVTGSVLVTMVGLPGLARLRRDSLDAIGLYSAMAVVCFGALSLSWLGTPVLPAPGIDEDDVAQALLIVALGLAAFLVSARFAAPSRARAGLWFDAAAGTRPALLAVLFAIGAATTAVGLARGIIGYRATTEGTIAGASDQIFAQGAAIGAMVVLVCALQAFGAGDRRAVRLLPWLLACQIVVGFLGGYKGQSLVPIVYVALAYLACTTRVPSRSLVVGVIATIGILLPANFVYRAVLRGDATGGPQTVLTDATELASARFRYIDHVALINARTPSLYAYGDGTRYLYLPLLVAVPRVLWEGKPILDDGIRFSQTYWEIPPQSRTSTPLTQVGDLLRNFGLIGVVIGMALWGGVVSGFLVLCRRVRSPRVEMIYLVSLVSWVTYVEGDLPTLVAAASRSLPLVVAMAWLLLPGRSQRAGYQVLLERGSRTSAKLRRAAWASGSRL